MFDEYTSTYRIKDAQIEQLDVVLRQIGLDRYIANENVLGLAKEGKPKRRLKPKGNGVKETLEERQSWE